MATETESEAGAGTEAEYRGEPSRRKLVEIARYFLFIGVVDFGGRSSTSR